MFCILSFNILGETTVMPSLYFLGGKIVEEILKEYDYEPTQVMLFNHFSLKIRFIFGQNNQFLLRFHTNYALISPHVMTLSIVLFLFQVGKNKLHVILSKLPQVPTTTPLLPHNKPKLQIYSKLMVCVKRNMG